MSNLPLSLSTHQRSRRCHTDNLYDCSLLKDGDKVCSLIYPNRGVGTVKLITVRPPNLDSFIILEVTWGDGSVSNPYPNQLEFFED